MEVVRRSETSMPDWVTATIENALRSESSPVARSHLEFILENIALAREKGLPICQDTGLLIFHLEMGSDVHAGFDIREAVADGVRIATREVPLRPNAVDPITRKNSEDNTGPGMPDIIEDNVDGKGLRITVLPKGAGSENMSLVGMLNPADDPLDFILRTVAERASNACPPLFLGIGIGGTFDLAARMAKRALLSLSRPGSTEMELELLSRINALGIGPMGLGGDTTILGLKIEKAACHTASLPVAVNFQCWANRRASALVTEDGWSID